MLRAGRWVRERQGLEPGHRGFPENDSGIFPHVENRNRLLLELSGDLSQ